MTSFTERFAAMVGMRARDKERVITGTDKSKTFGIITALHWRLVKEGNRIQRERRVNHRGL